MTRIYCPVDGCDWWVADGGYTYRNIDLIRRHIVRDHNELSSVDARKDGGIFDRWLSDLLAEHERVSS